MIMEDDLNQGTPSPETTAMQNDYLQVEREIQERNAQRGFSDALTSPVSPDDAAKVIKKARKYKLPVAFADTVTPQQEAEDEAEKYQRMDRVFSQPAFARRMTADTTFANLVKDDIGNVSSLAALHWKMWGYANEKPDGLWGAFSNSAARGGYALANTLPGFGAVQSAVGDRAQLDKFKDWQKQVDAGQTPDEWKSEVDPEGRIARDFWGKNGAQVMAEYERRIQKSAEAIRWATDMAAMFPASAAMDRLNDAKTLGEGLGAFLSSPLMTLADIGPESLVQSAPMLAAAPLLPGLAAPLAMGAYSAAQDRSASFLGYMADLGVDLHDSKQIANFVLQDSRYQDTLAKAEKHAAPVGMLDALSFGVAKWTLPKESKWLTSFAPDASRSYAKFMAEPFKNKLLNQTMQTALQGTMGGAGEALGQIAAEGSVTNWADVVAEFAGESFSAPVEVMSATRSAWAEKSLEVQRAKDFQERLQRQNETVQQSATMERDPQSVVDMNNEVDAERAARGEPPATIYLGAQALNQEETIARIEDATKVAAQLAPESGIDKRLADIRTKIAQASAKGEDLTISAGDFLLLQKADGALMQEVAPFAHPDGDATLAEAEAAAQDILDGQPAQISKALASETPEFKESSRIVGELIANDLKAQKGMSKSEQKAAVTLIQTLVANTAKDAGMTPEAVWQAYGLAGVLDSSDVHVDDQGRLVADSEKGKKVLTKSRKIDLNQSSSKKSGLNGSYLRDLRVVIRWTNADQSTFLHETGHMFLDMRLKLATALAKRTDPTEGQKRLVDLAQKTVQWLGVKDLDAFNKLSAEQQRPLHEKFARTYEAYLAEGNAPTMALRDVFRKFTAWLKRIYGAITAIPDAQMSDEVRALFDGLFVAAEEEQTARTLRGLYSLADMLEESYRDPLDGNGPSKEEMLLRYVGEYFAQTQAEAEEILRAKGFQSMGYIRRLHKATVSKLTKEAKKLRDKYTLEEAAKVVKEKPYRTYDLLKNGMIRKNGTRFTPKLYEPELKALGFTDEQLAELRARGLSIKTKSVNYVPGEAFAQNEGFTSLAEMANTLLDCEPIESVIEARVDNRMIEEHAELHDAKSIQQAADQAIFNPSAARMLAAEISYLEKSTGAKRVSSAMFEKIVTVMMGADLWKALSPTNARARASELGRRALQALRGNKRDTAKAAELKRQQLFQTCWAIQAQKAQDSIKRMWEHVKKERSSKTIDRDFKIQLESFVARLGGAPYKGNDKVPGYAEFQAKAAERGLVTPDMPEVVERVLHGYLYGKRQDLEDLTVDEATATLEFLTTFAKMGRNARKVDLAGKQVDLETAQGQAAEAIIKHARERGMKPLELGAEDKNRKKDFFGALRNFDMMHRRAQSLFASMEGGHGILYEIFSKPADACATKKEKLTHDLAIPFDKAMYPLRHLLDNTKKVFYPELNASLSKRQIVAAILNCGTESNRERLIEGSDKYDWTAADKNGVKQKWKLEALLQVAGKVLSAKDLDNIQKAWDVIGSLWDDVVALEEREGNRAPKKEEASSITIPIQNADGSVTMKPLKGGYYPVKYDPELSGRASQREDTDQAKLGLNAAYGASKTDQSRVQRRSEKANGDAIELTLTAGFDGLATVIHDLCWREFVNNASKMMQPNGELAATIRRYWGTEAEKAIHEWIDDIANDGRGKRVMGDRLAAWFRRNVSFAGIGFNLVTAAIQPIGIVQSVAVLGGRWTLAGVGKFIENPFEMKRMVEELSPMMAARSRTRFREIAEIQQRVAGGYERYRDKVMRMAYLPIVAMQALVDIPTWLGAYNKGLSEGLSQDDAVALADRLTIEAQGSGRLSDLSEIERKKGFYQLLTTFYTFFNAAYNVAAVSKSNDSTMRFIWNMTLLLCLQPVIEAFVREGLKAAVGGSDDDWLEKTARKAVLSVPNFTLNLWVGAREFADLAELMAGEQVMPYQGPAGMRIVNDFHRLGTQIGQGELDDGLLKAMVSVAGITTGAFPVVPVNRFISGISAMDEDDDVNALSLILGAPSK
nr:MAG TPA: crystallin beta/gamma motif-containing protein [Caudoviricetes sp.]